LIVWLGIFKVTNPLSQVALGKEKKNRYSISERYGISTYVIIYYKNSYVLKNPKWFI